MSHIRHNQQLNLLLIRVVRCLLQYTSECWPWASVDESGERQAIQELGQQQHDDARRIVDLLVERGWAIDFGNFPTEFTDLHYVALDFLLRELNADEDKLVAALRSGQDLLATDTQAAALIGQILHSEQDRAARLRALASTSQPSTTV